MKSRDVISKHCAQHRCHKFHKLPVGYPQKVVLHSISGATNSVLTACMPLNICICHKPNKRIRHKLCNLRCRLRYLPDIQCTYIDIHVY